MPFFVRPPKGKATARILFLVPTLTYMAYGNEHFDELPRHLAPHMNLELCIEEYDYIRENRLGSMYDLHPDGTGHGYFSRRRPIVNLRPTYYNRVCAGPFAFSADLHITDWLEEMDYEYDVATDEDLHFGGRSCSRNTTLSLLARIPSTTAPTCWMRWRSIWGPAGG